MEAPVDRHGEATAAIAALRAKRELVIGIIVFERVVMLDFIGPAQYLQLLADHGVPVRIATIGVQAGPLRSGKDAASGIPLYASASFQDVPSSSIDILVVPGGIGRKDVVQHAELMAYIGAVAASATFVLSVCTGAELLARCGALDGRTATTNKLAFEEIAAQFPAVTWVRRARWCVDGRIWTSSGVAAGMDMAHAFIATVYGEEMAATMAKYLEIVPNKNADDDPFA